MAAAHKKAIGRRIAELREAKGWSQPRLAAEIPAQEVDAQQVSKWERGIHTPRKHLESLAAALDVTEGEILAGDREKPGGPAPDPFESAPNGRLDELEDQVNEIRLALADGLDLLADVAAAQASTSAKKVERESHPPGSSSTPSAVRQRASRLRRQKAPD